MMFSVCRWRLNLVENHDITKYKIIQRLATIQLSILVKKRENTTLPLYDGMDQLHLKHTNLFN
jgi:hypothetical protein